MAIRGIDVSVWNENVNWQAVKDFGIKFVMIRTTMGKSNTDEAFLSHYEGARSVGLKVGAYHYSYALTPDDAVIEAEHCRNFIASAGCLLELPVFFDMEDADGYKSRHGMPSNSTLVDICEKECEVFENAGYQSMVYASSSWFKGKLSGLKGYEKWEAHWPTYSNGQQKGNATSPSGESADNCAIWQFTSQGRLNGYNGNLDMNYAYKDFVVKGGKPNPKPTPTKSNEEVAKEVKESIRSCRI